MKKDEEQVLDPRAILGRIDGGKPDSTFGMGQVVYSQNDPARLVFYVRVGSLKVNVVSEEGKEAVVAILGPGDFFGEECLAGRKQYIGTVTALTECRLMPTPKASIIRALRNDPEFCELFTTYVVERSIRVQEDFVDQLLNSTEKRLARLLLNLASYGREDWPKSTVPRINQETLAEMIGTTRTNVNLFMNRFRELGLIEYNGDIKVKESLSRVLTRKKARK